MRNTLFRGLVTFVCCAILLAPVQAQTAVTPHTFSIGDKDFLLDGKPFQIRCGEIHFARIPREDWRQRLQMCKAMGLRLLVLEFS